MLTTKFVYDCAAEASEAYKQFGACYAGIRYDFKDRVSCVSRGDSVILRVHNYYTEEHTITVPQFAHLFEALRSILMSAGYRLEYTQNTHSPDCVDYRVLPI